MERWELWSQLITSAVIIPHADTHTRCSSPSPQPVINLTFKGSYQPLLCQSKVHKHLRSSSKEHVSFYQTVLRGKKQLDEDKHFWKINKRYTGDFRLALRMGSEPISRLSVSVGVCSQWKENEMCTWNYRNAVCDPCTCIWVMLR